jgi:outer membrane protein assembly factor BamB
MFNGGLAHWSRLPFAGPAHAEFTEQSGFYEIGSYAGVAIAADGTRYDVSSRTHREAGTALAATSADGLEWTVSLSRWGGGIVPCERTPAVGSDGTIYVGSYDGTLYAISPAGSVKWKFAAGDYIDSSVAIASDGSIYLAGGYFLYAINPDGSLRWKYPIGWGTSSPAVDDNGTVYICGGNRMQMYAVDSQGDLRWKYTMPKQVHASPLVADTGPYCVDEDGMIYSLARDGRLRWNLATGDPVYGSPALGLDGTIYVQSEGAVHAVSAEGSLRWTYRSSNIGSHVVCGGEGATPRVDSYGTIYVPCGSPDVCAIDPSGKFLGYYRPANP